MWRFYALTLTLCAHTLEEYTAASSARRRVFCEQTRTGASIQQSKWCTTYNLSTKMFACRTRTSFDVWRSTGVNLFFALPIESSNPIFQRDKSVALRPPPRPHRPFCLLRGCSSQSLPSAFPCPTVIPVVRLAPFIPQLGPAFRPALFLRRCCLSPTVPTGIALCVAC